MPDGFKGTVFRKNRMVDYKQAYEEQPTNLFLYLQSIDPL